jgi:hypothetical protein
MVPLSLLLYTVGVVMVVCTSTSNSSASANFVQLLLDSLRATVSRSLQFRALEF